MEYRIGQGLDIHAIQAGLKMRLCGVEVAADRGFVAHSDGDVALHALCDALLGAAGLGDIGVHFPDTDPAYRGIDSAVLLSKVRRMISDDGWSVVNADITIELQSPKISAFVPQMKRRVAEMLGVEESVVNVKATTTERLGAVGRGEGCVAHAIVLLSR
ncbi:MAG: 2-C-methyl-D-erythritol 2,4-cyclodiphosphate synthase [Bacteroidales bacterium]|nr:2-C-methyl-D-erythritol 2,4-cyclodiphosphate synthase [Bacteroidales bacterium]